MAVTTHPLIVLKETLNLTISQLNDDVSTSRNQNYRLEDFWSTFVPTSKVISHEVTKISMFVTKSPMPSKEEFKLLADNLEKAILLFLTAYTSFPEENGKTIRKIIKHSVINVLKSIQALCIEAINPCSSSQLISIGNVWEQCEEVTNLPKNNQSAVLQGLQEQLGLVNDALSELEESLSEIDSDWTEAEKQFLPYCQGLVKASKAVLKKSKAWVSSLPQPCCSATNKLLDDISSITQKTSSQVDDFVLSVYVPIDHRLLKTNALTLMENLNNLLNTLKNAEEANPSCDLSWVDFLKKAVQHNFGKIDELLLKD